ncbi:TC1 transposase-like protein [Elysia marginata]|uniref:TC1 transposase-like protein n=1 Tax=Elysia marginata TaxID=1093978 RepID=A0AAV4IEE2_9GAST|nr:TC1 transposase-like protein [Elysia marginata]
MGLKAMPVAGLALLGLGNLLHIVGLATPEWETRSGGGTFGLWKSCGLLRCVSYPSDHDVDELKICQATAVLGMIAGVLALALAVFMVIRKYTDKDIPKAVKIGVLVASILSHEAAINKWTKRTRGRARQGDRAVRIVHGRRGPNLTLTFAVNVMNGLVHDELHQGGMTAERLNQFLHDTSLQCNPGQEVCFTLADMVVLLKLIICQLNLKCSTYQLLPPYSPFLNICENAFALWKQALKTRLAEVCRNLSSRPSIQ